MFASIVALAQSEDIFQRLRQALQPAVNGELAAKSLAEKNFAQVEALLSDEKASSNEKRAELLSLRGAVEFLDGKMRPAAASFQEAAKLAPLGDSDSFTLAMALVNLGDATHSRAVLEDLANRHPERAIYVYWLGRIDYDQRRYEEAVVKLRRSTDLDPQSARAWDSLGLAFDMQGQFEQALVALQKAVNLNRSQAHPSPWPPTDLGYLLLRMEKSKEADASLREAIRYNSDMPEAHYHLGRVLEKEERNNEAIDEYMTAVSLNTTSTEACYSLAILYRKLNRGTDANAMFTELKKRKQALEH